jgi:hypothetical protein
MGRVEKSRHSPLGVCESRDYRAFGQHDQRPEHDRHHEDRQQPKLLANAKEHPKGSHHWPPLGYESCGSSPRLHFAFANKPRHHRGQVAAKLANYPRPTMAPNRFNNPIEPTTLENMRVRSARQLSGGLPRQRSYDGSRYSKSTVRNMKK